VVRLVSAATAAAVYTGISLTHRDHAVARALVNDPALVLADEPTGNLHTDQGKEIMALMKNLNNGGTTIIQVTHSDINAKYGNRIIKLKDGWIEK